MTEPSTPQQRGDVICRIEGCTRKHDPRRRTIRQRIEEKVRRDESGCLLWTAATNGAGYGRLVVDHKFYYAHRAYFEIEVGPIPAGLQLDHLCRVPACVNPTHLEPVTQSENLSRSPLMDRFSHRTHCMRGHEYTPENTERGYGPGYRRCKACRAIYRRWASEKKQQGLAA